MSASPPRGASAAQRLADLMRACIETVAEMRSCDPAGAFALKPLNPVRIVAAFSGGRDSTAMLEVLSRLARRKGQTEIASLTAVHVHHGLSPAAGDWAEACRAFCEQRGIDFVLERVFVNKAAGSGVEAAARKARYRALARVAREKGADVVMTAHHQDDRLETFLIQWIRGAGPEGLVSMNPVRAIERQPGSDVLLARPWLDVPGRQIEIFARRAKLAWVEDESNADTHYLRNLLRASVLSRIDEARPGWRQAAARSLALLTETADVLRSVSADDLAACAGEGGSLVIARLLALAPSRQPLCLRSWLASQGVQPPSKARLDDLLRQVRTARSTSHVAVKMDGRVVRTLHGALVATACARQVPADEKTQALAWNGEAELPLPAWGGKLLVTPCAEGEPGFDAARLAAGPLAAKARRGGEKLKLHPLRPSRNLKHLYQAAGVAAFERAGLPLVWLGSELIWAAGLGADVRKLADPGLVPARVKLAWRPDEGLLGL
ncbi:MAG: tRNA lysidine(34) synthetase TilS [Duodenibacillus sp.]|nr:tRNA lysidine(34) synthetase TilS [Duodenibacillus sp.]